jgi:hypothetical protein
MTRSILAARRAARTLLIPLGLIPLGGVAMFAAAPAHAATVRPTATTTTISLFNDGATVKTSNGQSWTMTVVDENSLDAMTVGIERTVTTGGAGDEQHTWGGFATTASSIKFSTSTGVGTISGGAATSPLAKIDLTFKATGHTAANCGGGGSGTVYTGTLSGEAELVTGLTGGGTVGGTSVTFNTKGFTPTVEVTKSCVPSINTCLALTEYVSGATGSAPVADGFTVTDAGKKVAEASVSHQVLLTTPEGVYREDEAVVTTAKQTWDAKTGTLSATSSSDGIVTGSATVSGGSPKKTTTSCSYAGKSYSVTTIFTATANYTSPAGKDMTAHTSLTGNLVALPAKGDSYLSVQTVTAK